MNKTIKCFISLMLVFSMIFTTMIGVVSAAPLTVADIVDVEDPQFDIVNLLVKLGVFKEGDEFPASMSESITRAEFVEYAMRLNRYNELDVSGTTELRYTDIDSSHKYYKTILLAAALNVLTYDEYDLTFKPDDYITFDEGLAVIINALGYKEYALHTGEYPSSYRVLATQLGLFDSLDSANNDGIMTYETACQLLFNAFTAPLFEVASTSELTGETFWQINESKSVLSEKHNIYEVEGVLTANDAASILPGVSAERGTARIGNTLYYNDNADEAVYDYLGYNVRAFYFDDEGRRELIYVGLINKKNDVFVLPYEDISDVRKTESNVIISYWDDNDNIDTITISPSTSVLFNDKAYNSSEIYKEWFHGDTFNNRGLLNNGEIVFLDNGGSNDYDVAFIYEYNTTIVDSVNVDNKYIYDVEDATQNIDLNHSANAMYYAITDETGNKLDVSDLKQWDVLSVAQSADGRVVKIKVARNSQNAIISAKHDADKKLTIGTKDYNAGERIVMSDIVLGEQVTVYYDVFDNVAYTEKVDIATGRTIAYLVSMGRSGRSSLGRDIDVLLVKSKEDETSVMRLAETLTLDGERVKSYTLFTKADHPSLFTSGNAVKQQVISYEVNDKNEIDYIDTARVGEELDSQGAPTGKLLEDPEETLTLRHTLSDSSLYLKSGYMATKGSADIKFAYSSSKATVFYIPTNPTDPTEFDSFESNSRTLADESEKKYDVYTMGNVSVVPIAFVLQESSGDSAGTIDEYAVPYYLEKILYTVYKDKDGEEQVGRKLCLMDTDAKATSVILPTENESFTSATKWTTKNANAATINLTIGGAVDLLGVGDILVHAVDTNGYLNNIQVLYDWDANDVVDGSYTPNTNAYQGLRAYHFGQVYHKESGYYSISPDPTASSVQIKPFPLAENASVNIFNVENGKLTYKAGTKKDVIDYKTYGNEATLSLVNARYASPQKKLFFKPHTGTGTSTDANFGKYPAYFVESETVTNVINTQRADAGQTITIPDNTLPEPLADGTTKLEISGFKFMGWTDGKNNYTAGSTYTMPEATVIFYPVWETAYNTTFTAGALTDADTTLVDPALGKFVEGETFTLPANPYRIAGYKFMGWNDGTTTYQPGDTYTMPANAVRFEAQWISAFTASFVGGAGTEGTEPPYLGGLEGDVITLPENTFTKTAVLGSYTFAGWSADDGVTVYQPGDNFAMPASNIEFTALWNYTHASGNLKLEGVYAQLCGDGDPDPVGPNGNVTGPVTGALNMGRNTGALMVAKIPVKGIQDLLSMKIDFYMNKINGATKINVARITKADYDAFIAKAGTASVASANYPAAAGTTLSSNYVSKTDTAIRDSYLTDPAKMNTSALDVTAIAQEALNINEDYLYFKFWSDINGANTDGWSIASIANTNVITLTGAPSSVNFDGNGADSGSVAAIPSVGGTEITLPANGFVKNGFEFLGWSVDGNEPVISGTYTVPEGGATLKAVWKPLVHFSFVSGRDDATTAAGAQTDYYGNSGNRLELPACMFNVAGWIFDGWSDGITVYPVGTPIAYDSDKTFTATWIQAQAATFDTGVEPVSALPGDEFTIPAMTGKNRDKVFAGWNDGFATYQPGDEYEMPENGITFTSVWNDGVTLDYTYATKNDFDTVLAIGNTLTLPSVSDKSGYELEGWTADNGTTILAPGSEYTVASTGVTLKALYSKNLTFTEWYVYDGSSIAASGSLGRNNGSYLLTTLDISGADTHMLKAQFGFSSKFQNSGSCYLHFKPVTGSYSTAFSVGDTFDSISAITGLTIGSDIAVTPQLSADPRVNGNAVYVYGEFNANLAPYITEQRLSGKESIQLAMNLTGGNPATDGLRNTPSTAFVKVYVLAGAPALVAGQPKYTATFVGGDGATGTAPTAIEDYEGASITLPANTFSKTSYEFAGWNDGTTTYAAGASYQMPANGVTFTAQWNEVVQQYTLTFAGNEGDVLSGTAIAPVTQNENTTYEMPANVYAVPTAVAGSYAFGGWTDGTNTVQPGDTVTLTANKTYKPVWTYTGETKSLNAAETYYVSDYKGTASTNANYQSYNAGDIISYTNPNYLTLFKNRGAYAYVKIDLAGIKAENLSSAVLDVNYSAIKVASTLKIESITEAAYKVAFPLVGTKTLPAVEASAVYTSGEISTATTAGTIETTDISTYIKGKLAEGKTAIYLRISNNDGGNAAGNGIQFNGATLKVVTE